MGNGIAYQNKDIISKTFTESLANKSLEVYGVRVSRIVRLLPTNLPAIEANELRLDNILEMEDGSVAILDYESEYDENDKAKYLNYLSRVFLRLVREGKRDVNIRMIVIYTADVEPKNVKTRMEKSGFSVTIEPAYLSGLDSEEILGRIEGKVRRGEPLEEKEQMELVVLPLTYKTKEKKRQAVKEAIELAKQIRDKGQANFIMAGIVVFSDKIIDAETKEDAGRWIKMTTIGRMFEEEKEEAVRMAKEAAKKDNARDNARTLLDGIERTAKGFKVSVEEARERMGISKERFEEAKKLAGDVDLVVA